MARFLRNRSAVTGLTPGSLIHLGSQKIEKPLLSLINYKPETIVEEEFENLEDCLPYISDNSVSWINIYGLHDAGIIQKLGDSFGLHSLLLEDMLNTDQRPKIVETEKFVVIILKILEYEAESKKLVAEQVSMILDDTFIITLQEKKGGHFEPIRARIRNGKGRVRRKGADYLTYVILDTIADNYLVNIEILGSFIEKTEAKIFMKLQPKGIMEEIYKHKTEINFLRKNIRPVKEIVNRLIENDSEFISPDNIKYFHDLNDLILQASETIEIYQAMLNDQMNIYHAHLDSKANEIMKVLTIFSAFFIPLSFVAGVYGTNFDNLPELHFKYGYLYFWILIIMIVSGLVVYFRHRKWF